MGHVSVELMLLLLQFVSLTLAGKHVSQSTTSDMKYYFLNDLGVKVTGNSPLIYDVMTCQDALIRFAETQDLQGNYYDVVLGAGGNSWSGLRDRCNGCGISSSHTGAILDCSNYNTLWTQWDTGSITFGTGSDVGVNIMFTFVDSSPFEIHYIAVASYTGQTGEWKFLIDEGPVYKVPSQDGSTSVSVLESSTSGEVILDIEAVDPEGDKVTFSLVDNHSGLFDIDGNQLTVAGSLNYEEVRMYIATISVTDGRNELNASVTILVMDVCDETPEIHPKGKMTVPEELGPDTLIGPLYSVTDGDYTDTLLFSLSGTDSSHFTIDQTTGQLTVLTRVDRDGPSGRSFHDQLTMTVTDSCGQSASLPLNITVLDINDNPPVFSSLLVHANITENSTANTIVTTLDVHDADSDGNNNVNLTLVDGDDVTNPVFYVTGKEVHVDGTRVDYEGGPNDHIYTLTIRAVDSTDIGQALSASCVLIVTILPSNEFPPVWVSPTPDLSGRFPDVEIPESTGMGTSVTSLSAEDPDVGEDGILEYSLISAHSADGSSAPSTFHIDKDRGIIRTASPLDRDAETGGISFYDLEIEVTDKGDHSQSIQGFLRIYLTDVNDHVPVVLNSEEGFAIDCTFKAGDIVWAINVTDVDISHRHNFSIIFMGINVLSINESTGELILKKNISSENAGNSSLVAIVLDDDYSVSIVSWFEVYNCSNNNEEGTTTTEEGNADSTTATTSTATSQHYETEQQSSDLPLTSELHDAGVLETWGLRAACGVLVITLSVIIGVLVMRYINRLPGFTGTRIQVLPKPQKLTVTQPTLSTSSTSSSTSTMTSSSTSPVTSYTSVESLDYFH